MLGVLAVLSRGEQRVPIWPPHGDAGLLEDWLPRMYAEAVALVWSGVPKYGGPVLYGSSVLFFVFFVYVFLFFI